MISSSHPVACHPPSMPLAARGSWRSSIERARFSFVESQRKDVEEEVDGEKTVDVGASLQSHLVENYQRLHSRLTHHLGCPDLASDSLHDAWLRLGEKTIEQAAQNSDAYVFRVACNVAMDRLRSERSWQYAGDANGEIERAVDPVPGPALVAEMRSEIAALDRAMQHMPRRHRAVLVALRIDEMARQEVATRYGLSLRTVDTALRKALDHCAQHTGRVVQGGVGSARRPLKLQQAQA